jgi:hypothetical protein
MLFKLYVQHARARRGEHYFQGQARSRSNLEAWVSFDLLGVSSR